MSEHPRLARERKTIWAMTRIFCRDRHGLPGGELCAECAALFAYAMQRLERCPYQEQKPTCANCPIHCYRKAMREQVRQVMRHAGPRMLLRHPWLAVRHLLDGRVKAPPLARGKPRDETASS